MSSVLNDLLTNAKSFVSSYARTGTLLSTQGDLERIKSLPTFSSNVPGSDLGSERILLGRMDACTYAIAKPFQTGTPFEATGPNGLPTGEKIAYGEEYSAIHVPVPYRKYLTSVMAYDSDARTTAI